MKRIRSYFTVFFIFMLSCTNVFADTDTDEDTSKTLEENITETFTYIKETITDENGDIIGYKIYKEFADGSKQFVQDVYDTVSDTVSDKLDEVKGAIVTTVDETKNYIGDTVTNLNDSIGGIKDSLNIFTPTNKDKMDDSSSCSTRQADLDFPDGVPSGNWVLSVGGYTVMFYGVTNVTITEFSGGDTSSSIRFAYDYAIRRDDSGNIDTIGGTTNGMASKWSSGDLSSTYYTNVYSAYPPGKFAVGSSVYDTYVGYGNPEIGLLPEDDFLNPDNPNYDSEAVNDVLNKIYNLNVRFKIDWSEFFLLFDQRIPQFGNGNIELDYPVDDGEDGKKDIFDITDVDFDDKADDGDSWFIRLLKAISDFFKSLIIPDDVKIDNGDGTSTTENYFTFEFNNMHDKFTEKVPVVEQVSTLVDDLNTGFVNSSSDSSPDVNINLGSISLMGDNYSESNFEFKVLDFSFMTPESRNLIHGVILLYFWLKFIISLPVKIQRLIRG